MKKRMNKKAKLVLETIIFIILNLVFMVVVLLFAYSSGNRELVYEQTYAKEVALIIDNAKPEMAILLDVSKLIEIAEENKKSVEEIFKIDNENNKVFVSLKGNRGYGYKYFTNAKIDLKIDGENLIIEVEE